MLLAKARAIILDFDGVVVDGLAAHLDAWAAAVRVVFRTELAETRSIERHATRVIASILAKRFGDPSLASSLADVKERLLVEGTVAVPLLGGARAFVDAARTAGIPLGIASNSRKAYVRALVARHALPVDTVLCGDEVRLPKPAPDLFWECGNRLGVAPGERERVLVFEDSLHGIEAARAAGMLPLGIASLESADALRRKGAVDVFRDLGEAVSRCFG